MIWRATTSGIFTVRSAYFIENDRKSLLMGEGSHSLDKDSFWKEIWSLKVSNLVKNFMWRACSNILPTKESLLRRGVSQRSCVYFLYPRN